MLSINKLLLFFSFLLCQAAASFGVEPPRLLHDRAHGETAVAKPLKALADKLGFVCVDSDAPITPELLTGIQILYLRAPSKEFTTKEQESIIDFVQRGGSLLLVLDEEIRQSLATTRVNEIIGHFGLKLTADLPYLHNCGGLARAGVINAADREIPYSGGRAAEGGTPFAFVLDKDGKPAEAFATQTMLPSGARIAVIGEGMVSLFLGTPQGVRLTGVPRDPANTVYWGKDSGVFMEELLTWLIKR